ncbi:MAG: LuxR C-terminal-related transcriptional regulator [Pseudomonadota bacterium]
MHELPHAVLEQALQTVPSPIGIVNRDFRLVWSNHECVNVFGVFGEQPQREVKCHEALHGIPGPCSGCPMEAGDTPESAVPYVAKRFASSPDGIEKWIEIKAWPVFDTNGYVTHAVEHVLDITQVRLLEAELEKYRSRLDKQACLVQQIKNSLRLLLEAAEEEKEEVREKVATQIADLVLPHVQRMRDLRLPNGETSVIRAAYASLQTIFTSGFVHRLQSLCPELTQREVQVASLVAQNLGNKEIAAYLGVSERAVEFHRYQLRKRLNLNSHKKNLQSFLRRLLK